MASKGKSVPALESQPEVHPDLVETWQAFQDLSNSRTVGFCVNPIQVSEIEAWLRIYGITEVENRVECYRLIKSLDSIWLTWSKQKQKEQQEAEAKKKKKGKK